MRRVSVRELQVFAAGDDPLVAEPLSGHVRVRALRSIYEGETYFRAYTKRKGSASYVSVVRDRIDWEPVEATLKAVGAAHDARDRVDEQRAGAACPHPQGVGCVDCDPPAPAEFFARADLSFEGLWQVCKPLADPRVAGSIEIVATSTSPEWAREIAAALNRREQ